MMWCFLFYFCLDFIILIVAPLFPSLSLSLCYHVTLNMALLLVPDGLVKVFQKLQQ